MKRRRMFAGVLLILVLATLGCGLLKPKEPEAVEEPALPTKAADQPAPTDVPEPTKEEEPTEVPPAPAGGDLGEEQRNEEGGFAFRVIPGYTVEQAFGMASMEAPDAIPDLGPAIMLMGALGAEEYTAEEFFANFTGDMEEGVELSEMREITVDGKPGVIAEVSGAPEGEAMVGRIVAAAPTPKHHFIMIAVAPADEWDAFGPQFDAVLASVRFFPPAGAEGPPVSEGTRQWAVAARASSQYGEEDWAAKQATGAPDTPECGDYTTAWAASGYDTVEWVELDYDIPVLPTEVSIFHTYNPNQIVKVELRDLEGGYRTIYTGVPEDKSDNCPFILYIPVGEADRQVNGVRITVDQSVLGDWAEIDAVELVGIAERPGMTE